MEENSPILALYGIDETLEFGVLIHDGDVGCTCRARQWRGPWLSQGTLTLQRCDTQCYVGFSEGTAYVVFRCDPA